MSTMVAIARKELRAYFLSPIALLFIGTFLLASLFAFFWLEGFFSRGVADVRPLFKWLPILFVFLVPALGMRLWSEEERMGTMELLRTLPLRGFQIVLGKFVSGVGLVAVALVLTVPLPVTAALLGDLDWGPVVGGYLASLLVAGAYLAITLCLSAATPNQIVALVFGSLACGLLYAVGAEPVVALFSNATGETMRALGAGSRFASIQRGVVDLRDLLYYASLISFFLLLNTVILASKRWSRAPDRAAHRLNTSLAVALVGLNLIALNVMTASWRGARIDLTENDEYSISDVTRSLLDSVDEPLLLRGYFSNSTHPALAPLVPRIRDLIMEYGAVGGERVRAEFVDPTTDQEIEREAAESFGIKTVPFELEGRHEVSVVNSYFSILIRYGDQYETLNFDDLIEIQFHGMAPDVKLRNLEYDLTRAIQKVIYGFTSIESVLARLPDPGRLRVVVTPEKLPPGLAEALPTITKVAGEIAERSGGRFTWEIVDPTQPTAALNPELLHSKYGIRPLAVSLFSEETFYFHLLLEVGDHFEQLVPPESLGEADIRKELLAALKRAGPGTLKKVGVVAGGKGPGALTFNALMDSLRETYQVESIDIARGRVPGDVDVLLLLDPRDLKDTAIYAIDQFLMRGGSAIIAAGNHAIEPEVRDRLTVTPVESGLDGLLETYGVKVHKEIVLDTESGSFPIPVTRNLGGFSVQEIQMLRYPAFVDVRGEGMNADNPAVSGLPAVILQWPSELELIAAPGAVDAETASQPATVLLSSSPSSWVLDDYQAEPNFDAFPDIGWPVRGEQKRRPLAVALAGPLVSHFKDEPPPVLGDEAEGEESDPADEPPPTSGRRGNVIEISPERTRLAVIGTASFVSDFMVRISRQVSDVHVMSFQLIHNLVDWCLEDVELLKIRSRGSFARVLLPTSVEMRQVLEWLNYLFAVLVVIAIAVFSFVQRKTVTRLPLVEPGTGPERREGSV